MRRFWRWVEFRCPNLDLGGLPLFQIFAAGLLIPLLFVFLMASFILLFDLTLIIL